MSNASSFSAGSAGGRLGRFLVGLPLGLALAAGCGVEEPLVHNNGGAFTPLGIDEAQLGKNGTPSYLAGHMTQLVQQAPDASKVFTGPLAASYRLAPETSFTVLSDTRDETGRRFIKLQQQHSGLTVVGREVVVQVGSDTSVEAIIGTLHPELKLAGGATLTGDDALAAALKGLGAEGAQVRKAPTQAIYIDAAEQPVLVYRATVDFVGPSGRNLDELFINAQSGALIARHPQIFTTLNRDLYDLKKACLKTGMELPGTLLAHEGGTLTDMSAKRASDSSGNVYWFYKHMYGRNSYDDKDSTIVASVHGTFDNGLGGCDGNNAAWIGDEYNQMVYGDGDGFGILLKDLTLGFDVAAHEMTHAVTFTSSNLVYMDDSGALNESMSDLFGATIEAWLRSGGGAAGNPASITPSVTTWKIGEEVAGFLLPGGALRFMNDPAADMASKDYYPDRIMPGGMDNGGVHFNSGIGNLAFYLMSQGGTHPRTKTKNKVTGIGIAKAGHIFYAANVSLYTSMTNYEGARYATAQAAENLYGRCSTEWRSVHQAWDAVGVPGSWTLCVKPLPPAL